jgi:hypothetical protein
MALYPKQSLQMLVDLINAANPSLPVALTTSNVLYGAPSAITPTGGNIQNTSIKVTAAAGTKYIGNTTLTYRRIDFGTLFRSLPIVIYKYSPTTAGQNPYKISDLLPAINAKYGLNLTTADVVDGSLPAGNTNAVPAIGLPAGTRNSSITVATQSASPGYVGSFTLYWVQAPQDISTMITVTNLENARVFPGGRNVVDNTLYVPDLDVFSYDFTAAFNQAAAAIPMALATWITYCCNQQFGTTSDGQGAIRTTLLGLINSASGKTYNFTNPASTSMSLYNIKAVHYTLPNAAVPEADSKYFNNCLVIDLLGANSWGAGRMILHYNV